MLQKIRNTNKNILFSVFASMTMMAIFNMFNPYIAPYLISNGFTKEQISLISSISPLLLIVAIPILGSISDQVGRKKVLTFSLILYITALVSYIFVGKNYLLLIIATMFSTLGYEAFMEAQLMRAEDEVSDHRAKFTGLYESLKSVGSITGSLVGTYLVSRLPINVNFKIALVFVIILLLFGFLHPSTKKSRKIHLKGNLNFIKDLKKYLSVKELRETTLLDVSMSFHHPAMGVFIPLFITQELKADIKYVGFYVTSIIIGHLFEFIFGYTCETYGIKKTMRRSVLVFSLALIALSLTNTPSMMIVISIFLGLAGSAWNTSVLCFLAETGEKRHIGGLVMGSYASIAYMSVFVSFLVSSLFIKLYGIRPIFAFYGSISLITLCYIYGKSFVLKKSAKSYI